MERCPICRARFKDDPRCYRCGSDLSDLLRIEAEAAAQERRALALLKQGRFDAARTAAHRALALKYSPLAAALVKFLAQDLMLDGDDGDRDHDSEHFPLQDQGL